jgi:hypothetical protein
MLRLSILVALCSLALTSAASAQSMGIAPNAWGGSCVLGGGQVFVRPVPHRPPTCWLPPRAKKKAKPAHAKTQGRKPARKTAHRSR